MIYTIPTTGYYQVSDWRQNGPFNRLCILLSKLGVKSAPMNLTQTVMYRRVGDTTKIIANSAVIKVK